VSRLDNSRIAGDGHGVKIGLVILVIGLPDYSTLITDREPMAMMAGE
jgi:hypothetical protein